MNPDIPFDPTLLLELERSVGEDSLGGELLRIYRRNSVEALKTLTASHARGDTSEVARAAHSLKSSSAQIGVFKVSALAKTLEIHMRMGGDLESAGAMIEAIRIALHEVDPLLAAELERRER